MACNSLGTRRSCVKRLAGGVNQLTIAVSTSSEPSLTTAKTRVHASEQADREEDVRQHHAGEEKSPGIAFGSPLAVAINQDDN